MPRFEVDYRGEQRVPLLVPDNATVQQMKELIAQRAHVHPTELQLIYSRKASGVPPLSDGRFREANFPPLNFLGSLQMAREF